MKKATVTALIILFTLSCQNENNNPVSTNEIKLDILAQISEPEIPQFSINLMDHGGKGDSTANNKQAFDKALEALNNNGGGTLIVPKGQYLINGPIHLVDNMNLHLKDGARIFFGSNPDDYLPVVKTSWEGTFINNYSPLIYAYQRTNISITGQGTIDGEASQTWGAWKDKQKSDQLLSRKMNHDNMPLEKRNFGKGHYLRPHLVQLFDCTNILIEGVRFEDSPFWCLHLVRCENVTVRGISFNAHNKNNDGIDPEYSRNVLIEDVTFNNSDDNIAIKAGRDNEGRSSTVCSENILIRNCHFKGLHAIVIGSEMSAGVQNIVVDSCTFAGYLKRGIYLKSNPDRGGFIRNIFVKNVEFGEVEDFIYITSYYHNEGEGHTTNIEDIYFENISCNKVNGTAIVLQGFPEKKLSNIYFKNIRVNEAQNAVSMMDTEDISFSNLTIGKPATSPSFVQ